MHAIEQQIDAVGSRARRLLLLHALCWVVTIGLGTIALFIAADYWLRFEDRGLRFIALLSFTGIAGWSIVRFLLPVWQYQPSPVAIARHIEKRFPGLRDRLASTVEFLQAGEEDPMAGSARLRRAVILETESDTAEIDWRSVIDPRATRVAAAIAATMVGFALLVAFVAPKEAGIGLVRLFNPLGNVVWPHVHNLAFKSQVTRLTLGQPFEVEVIDRHGRPPDDVQIQYRYQDASGETTLDEEKVPTINGALLARKDQVVRPFEYRAIGGDDRSMGWISLEVVDPPRLESLEITLHPPAYTGFAPQVLGGGSRRIEALAGTRVDLSGGVTKSLAGAVLKQEHGESVPATLGEDGESFSIRSDTTPPFLVTKSGKYWLELMDRENLIGGIDDRWEIKALVDPPPTISLERPAANLFVTAEAIVPIRAVVKDNLAIRRIALVYSHPEQAQPNEQSVDLYGGPEKAAPAAGETMTSAPGESRIIEHRWDLAPLKLPAGAQLFIRVDAEDYQPTRGTSTVRKLTIVTPEEMEERLSARENTIVAELARVLKSEQEVRSVTRGVDEQLADVGALRRQDADQLQGAEMNQRQLRRSLTSSSEGVAGQIAALVAELENNRMESPEIKSRLTQMAGEISRLDHEPLAEIEQQMTAAVKNIDVPRTEDHSPLKSALHSAGQRQDEVVAALEKLLADLGQWNTVRSLARDIGQIQREQAALEKQTRTLGAETLTRTPADLSAQQVADLKKLAGNQDEISRRFEKVLGYLDQVSQRSGPDNESSNPNIDDALQAARDLGLSAQMRDSSRAIENNRIGQSLENQSAIQRGLDEMLDIMANRREQDLNGLVKKLRDSEAKLANLRQEQVGLRKQLQSLAEQLKQAGAGRETLQRQLERLTRKQRQLQQESQRLARQLQRLQAERAAAAVSRASGAMDQAAKAGDDGESDQAGNRAAEAQRDLDEAQAQMAQALRQAQRDLANEQLAKISDSLKSLEERQARIVDEIAAHERHRQSPQGLTTAQKESVANLGRTQSDLGAETAQIGETIAEAEVFHLALTEAAEEMATAGARMAQHDTGAETQQAAGRALEHLRQIVSAMAEEKDERSPKNDGNQPGGAPGGGDQQGEAIADLAEVKLLKLMQDQLNERTREIDKATAKQTMLTELEQQEYTEIARQQGRLAELIAKRLAPNSRHPENNPDTLPDVRKRDEQSK